VLALPALIALPPVPAFAQRAVFGHELLDTLLRTHVRDGLVDYDGVARDPRLPRYLAQLDAFEPAVLPRAERLAFWLNAYNAYTLALIVRHGERESIRNINKTFGLALKGPWRERLVRIGGKTYSLDDVEQRIIRPTFQEPRVHFALVCAALGCPTLRSEAYRGELLESQLDDQTRHFLLASPDKNRIDISAGRVVLSPIFDWYGEDFGGSRVALGRYLSRFFPPGPERALLEGGRFALTYSTYDWRLNTQRR